MFKKIKPLINKFLIDKKLHNTQERETIEEVWEKTINKEIKKQTKILSYYNKTLTVKTKNPTWKMEINLIKNDLKKNLILNNLLW